MISFRVNCVPVAQPRQRHRIITSGSRTFAHNYTPAKHPVNVFKSAVVSAASELHKGKPTDLPIRLAVLFLMPRPARLVWKTRPMPRQLHTSKPDTENMVKALLDCLTKVIWFDDSQVCWLVARKYYAAGDEMPGVAIDIEELTG